MTIGQGVCTLPVWSRTRAGALGIWEGIVSKIELNYVLDLGEDFNLSPDDDIYFLLSQLRADMSRILVGEWRVGEGHLIKGLEHSEGVVKEGEGSGVFESGFDEGVKYALRYLSDPFENMNETTLWHEYIGEGCECILCV